VECSEAQRRGPGCGLTLSWESAAYFTNTGAKLTVKHPLKRIPQFVDVLWERTPRFKAAMAGQPEPVADYKFSINRRALDEVEVQFDVATGAEPGTFRLRVMG
jgi:hypothetical protein